MASKEEIKSGNYVIPMPEEVVENIPEADYAEEAFDFKEDIGWFREIYGKESILGVENSM